jgi:prenyltransferase beta subunit
LFLSSNLSPVSLRLEMLQVARLAPKLLGDSTELVKAFLSRQQNEDGGFKDRAGRSDLYYTAFGLNALLALQVQLPVARVETYLQSFGSRQGLDFVHLCCLARSWATLRNSVPKAVDSGQLPFRDELLHRIEAFRSVDGGYHPIVDHEFGTAYGCFLALGAYQDLDRPLPDPVGLTNCLRSLETEDGAWANERNIKIGSTNATAAAIAVLRQLDAPPRLTAGDWLLARFHSQGGFLGMPDAPMPDLLSTATSLHALAGLQVPLERIKEPCLDFIDTLWTNEGGLHGHWGEDTLDCEYTFYGLLALGHLAVISDP